MNARERAVEVAGSRSQASLGQLKRDSEGARSTIFGSDVFGRSVMEKMLPAKICANVFQAMTGLEKIKPEYADSIAVAMKEWAMSLGATHYTHWFQPLTGAAAEKHDSFMDWDIANGVIEKFSGRELLQGEPDASSFPSGGLRRTFEARGYSGWDPSSPAFVWTAGDGVTLFVPSVFFSWTGEVLDTKIPLHRSSDKLERAVLRLLNMTGVEARHVFSTVGIEQEYFIVDRALHHLRPDLMLSGRTVFGASPAKGQELQDHYFGSVKDRILRFMLDFEVAAIRLGIPVKTRHNEVAPAQHEVAPVHERASLAVDHNIILMELMRQIAIKHDLTCLLHEKPFAELNGSGKHTNWSLLTDRGLNLLDSLRARDNSLPFLIVLTAILHAVHRHAALLRASIGSLSNDFRLGGHEAPPAIMSVYLGEELENLLDSIEKGRSKATTSEKRNYNLGIPVIPDLPRDNTDRNRTSPFAFTGNKFEFRAVGASASAASPVTVLNAIVAESLDEIMDDIETNIPSQQRPLSPSRLANAALPVLRKYLKRSRAIRFSGDNYSEEWIKEATARQLPNIRKSLEAFEAYKAKSTVRAFEGILVKEELDSRYEIVVEQYAHTVNIDVRLMVEMFRSSILPAAIKTQERLANSILARKKCLPRKSVGAQEDFLMRLSDNINEAIGLCDRLEKERNAAGRLESVQKAKALSQKVTPIAEKLRKVVDQLETLVDDQHWPIPKYRELLFLV